MKKLMYLCLACFFVTAFATAQKVTAKDLEGTWKMTAFNSSGVNLDLATKQVTIAPELESQLDAEAIAGIREGMAQAVEPLSMSSVIFKGNTFTQVLGPDSKNATYTLVDRDNQQHLDLKMEDGTADDATIAIIDKKLHLTQTDGAQQAVFIYTKQ